MNYKEVYTQIHQKRIFLSVFEIYNTSFCKQHTPDNPHQKILDLGCGNGYFLNLFKKSEVYGLDIAKNCLLFNIEHFIVGDMSQQLPVKDGSFDIVTSLGVIEHFTATTGTQIFQEVHRILKSRGLFISAVPNTYSIIQRIYDYLKETRSIRKFLKRGIYKGQQHLKLYSPSEYKRMARNNRFEVVNMLPLNLGIFNLIIAPFVYEGRFYSKTFQPVLHMLIKFDWMLSKLVPTSVPLHIQYLYIFRK
jgi:SAM-dependent methyltransferase